MRITIELDLVAQYHEYDNGTVSLQALTFPNCTQNVLPFLSVCEQDAAQQALEDEIEKATEAKYAAIRERREMRADIAREFQQEALRQGVAQRGVR